MNKKKSWNNFIGQNECLLYFFCEIGGTNLIERESAFNETEKKRDAGMQ